MAKYGTEKVFGGTSYSRDTDPIVSGKANSLGLYPWSAFRARLGTGTDTTFTALTSLADNAVVSLLLFTSDVLAIGAVVDAAGTAGTPITGLIAPALSVAFFDATNGGSDLSVPVGSVGQGYVGSGATAVECAGFPATVTVTAASTTVTDILVLANSPNISSPVSLQNWASSPTSAAGALPVILSQANYSIAIRDAGNQIVTSGGTVYQVVGLYAVA
jgi:hypothetical protein